MIGRTGSPRVISEGELRSCLHDSARTGTDYVAEGGAADVSIDRRWTAEACMVEGVEHFHAELGTIAIVVSKVGVLAICRSRF